MARPYVNVEIDGSPRTKPLPPCEFGRLQTKVKSYAQRGRVSWAAGVKVSPHDEGLILVPGFRASDAPRVTAAETLKAEDNGYRLACAWVGSRVS